ncbi:lysozyme inhibitor LprI family protein [Aeromonas sp. 603696]|uniref:lysozyme inhibitor LprI family protein n=1 Tax=Aeromonas sp. 603696 TaxID=2712049 RepID=UPI003BA38F10
MNRLVVGMALITFSISAFSASFDCALASSKVEKQICSNQELSALDSRLGQVYKPLSKNSDVRQSQRDWIRDVRNAATNDAIMIVVYKQRISELEQIVSKDDVESESKAPEKQEGVSQEKNKIQPVEQVKGNKDKANQVYTKSSFVLASLSLCEQSNLVFQAERLKDRIIAEAKEDLGEAYSAETMRNYYKQSVRKVSNVKSLSNDYQFIQYCRPYVNLVNEMNAEEGEDIDF